MNENCSKIRPYQTALKERGAIIALFKKPKCTFPDMAQPVPASTPPFIHQIFPFPFQKQSSWTQPVAGSPANPTITGCQKRPSWSTAKEKYYQAVLAGFSDFYCILRVFSCGGQMTRVNVSTKIFRRETEADLGLFRVW